MGSGVVVGSSVGVGFITNVIFGTGVPVDSAFGGSEEGEGKESVAFLLRARVRGILGDGGGIGGDGGEDAIFAKKI